MAEATHITAKQMPRVRGMQLNTDDARKAFEAFGAALAKLEPINKREVAKVRMRMNAEVFGWGRFLRRNYWRWWWIAYGPNDQR